MRILLAHNRYQQRGGEDAVFDTERGLLEQAGHEVTVYERHNQEIGAYSVWKLLDLSRRTVWATDSASSIRTILAENRPQVAHFYNTFPLISPAPYYACASAGVPVIQTLPNYRLICPGANLSRDGKICELCVTKRIAWPGIRHRCYRGSFGGTAVVAAMLTFHGMAKTWNLRVNTFIALTEFSRQKYIAGGLPADKIVVKPNFVNPDPGPRSVETDYALFVGRLSGEKGIATLLEAWERLHAIPLKVAGEGPLMGVVETAAKRTGRTNIELLGWRSRDEIVDLMKGARFLVIPSVCYEGFPLTIVEAFACGVPVIGSRLGGIEEVIRHGESGLLFEAGNATDLAATTKRLWTDKTLRVQLGHGARSQFESHYTAQKNYEMIMDIFEKALGSPPRREPGIAKSE